MSSDPHVLSGRYRVDAIIGSGGMTTVHRGYDLMLGRDVAVKILHPRLAADVAFRTRFRLEAQSASRMSSPSIVRVYDVGEDTVDADDAVRAVPFIVTELVSGRLLKDVIASGPVPVRDAVRYADGILEALEYSHRAGIVHRDITPGNVMVTDAGQVKVMDFGIARAVADSSATVAETTAILGTAAYLSPEQAKGEVVDARADLYSTGVVLYELLTGRPPFRGDTPVAIAYQHVSEVPVPPSEVRESVPRTLDAVVLQALAKDPYRRFADAAEFRDALDDAADGRVPTRHQVDTLAHTLYGPDPRQAAETARSLRQLSQESAAARTQAGPPVAWIWTGLALLAVVLISVIIWVVAVRPVNIVPGDARVVPDVTGMSSSAAVKALMHDDLLATVSRQTSDTVRKGTVIRTEPLQGVTVKRDSEVTVYVSKGAEAVTVPKLVGLTRAQAESALQAAGLTVGLVTEQDDPGKAAGIVTAASLPSGQTVTKGSAVDLTVATGTVTVNNMTVTFTVDQATAALKALDLSVTVQDDPGCPATNPRTVASQSTTGEVPIHSGVTLVTCTGKARPSPAPTH